MSAGLITARHVVEHGRPALELAEVVPHFASVAARPAGGPCAAAIAPDGSVIAAYVQGTGTPKVFVTRVTTLPAGRNGRSTQITTDAGLGGVRFCVRAAWCGCCGRAAPHSGILRR